MSRVPLFLIVFLFFSCDQGQTKKVTNTTLSTTNNTPKKVKNIILLIGDGMGLTQISAGMYSQGNKTSLEEFPVIGLHKSHASNKLVTDSAAGATAFSCGVKTYNGAIGVDKDTMAVETILEKARKQGMKTGLVASSTIVHATPASFYSHNKSRKNYDEIADDLAQSSVDFFVGGGKMFFTERAETRKDLYQSMRSNGYMISDFFESELKDITPDLSKKFGFLTANKDPLPVAQGRDYLPLASEMAIEYLDAVEDKGFFLMIEGSQIDWGGHANNGEYVVSEFVEFDQIIGNVLDFAEKDGQTLVIVTADHETGGLAIQPESTMDSLQYAFTSTYHTGTMIPVFAYGPDAEIFAGIYENTEIFYKMLQAFDFK